MALLRRVLGETLRGQRLRQERTLREVSHSARVSLGYLSEVERGQKEASSELLAAICEALHVKVADVLREVSDNMRRADLPRMPVTADQLAAAAAKELAKAGADDDRSLKSARESEAALSRDVEQALRDCLNHSDNREGKSAPTLRRSVVAAA